VSELTVSLQSTAVSASTRPSAFTLGTSVRVRCRF